MSRWVELFVYGIEGLALLESIDKNNLKIYGSKNQGLW